MDARPLEIPAELKNHANWVVWDEKKIPYNPITCEPAKANDHLTWGTFETARAMAEQNGFQGVGFELGEDPQSTPFVFVDLDHCRDPETGNIDPDAADIALRLGSYTEISPSGTGLHVIVKGTLLPGGRRKGSFEFYDSRRYFTITGDLLPGCRGTIEERTEVLRDLHREIFGTPQEVTPPTPNHPMSATAVVGDEDILSRALGGGNGLKVKRLFEGDVSDYSSPSEADLALCSLFAFWTGDPGQLDRLFRRSALYRGKWDQRHYGDGKTYGEETIRKALEGHNQNFQTLEPGEMGNEPTKTGVELSKTGAELSITTLEPGKTGVELSKMTPELGVDPLAFPAVIGGVAGEFADIYGAYLETPPHFLFVSFLTILGNLVADRLTIRSELKPQPRLFTVLLGESADPRKSTTISKTAEIFQDVVLDFKPCWGVGSAEGLQRRLDDLAEPRRLLLCFDEFKTFVSKARIDASVLLPCVNTLFEANQYHNSTKKETINLQGIYISLLAASTVQTYERVWDSSFTDIGFSNRLFLVPGKGERKFAIPERIPEQEKDRVRAGIRRILGFVGYGKELTFTPGAKFLYQEWYTTLERSIHANRLDTYGLRFMCLLAANSLKDEIDEGIVRATISLLNWQLAVRKIHDPIDADSTMAKMEEKFRRILGDGTGRNDREMKRRTHCSKEGLWVYNRAKENLLRCNEIRFERASGLYFLNAST